MFEPFKLKDIQKIDLGPEALKTMQEKLGNVWMGPDVNVEGVTVIQPGEVNRNLKILISKENLPPVPINQGTLSLLKWSVRSFLAQSGVDIRFHEAELSQEMINTIESGGEVAFPVEFENFGQRAVEVEGKVMRFFWVNDQNRLQGDELREIIGTGLIIDGEEGKDWFLGDADWDLKDTEEHFPGTQRKKVCVVVRLSKNKFYIPPSSEPLRVRDNKGRLAGILQPIPEGANLKFQIGETPHIHLSENITAVIPTTPSEQGHHIHSPLIDPGTDWSIRTETVGLDLDSIELWIYKNK